MNVSNYTNPDNKPTTMSFQFSWLTVYFSYHTCVAFTCRIGSRKLHCERKNRRSTTTSKHVTRSRRDALVGEKDSFRLDDERFDVMLRVLERMLGERESDELADELAAMMGCDAAAGRV